VILTWIFGILFGRYLSDVLNGYKVFSRDVYHAFNYTATSFEIEIELVVNALRLNRQVTEVASRERARLGGEAKSYVVRHGTRFLWRIIKEYMRNLKTSIKSKTASSIAVTDRAEK